MSDMYSRRHARLRAQYPTLAREADQKRADRQGEPTEEQIGRALYRAGLTSYPYATAEILRFKRALREGR